MPAHPKEPKTVEEAPRKAPHDAAALTPSDDSVAGVASAAAQFILGKQEPTAGGPEAPREGQHKAGYTAEHHRAAIRIQSLHRGAQTRARVPKPGRAGKAPGPDHGPHPHHPNHRRRRNSNASGSGSPRALPASAAPDPAMRCYTDEQIKAAICIQSFHRGTQVRKLLPGPTSPAKRRPEPTQQRRASYVNDPLHLF